MAPSKPWVGGSNPSWITKEKKRIARNELSVFRIVFSSYFSSLYLFEYNLVVIEWGEYYSFSERF